MLTVSYTEIKRWRFCRQAHYYAYVEKIVPRIKPKPLKVGNIIHKLIETWSKKGDCEKILKEIKAEYKKMFEEEKEYYGDLPGLVEQIFEGYKNKYGVKERQRYSLIEKTMGPIQLTSKTQLKFKIDKMMRIDIGNAICETKTAKRMPEENKRMWDIQTLLYAWGLTELGYEIDAVLWDYVRTKTPTIPPLLKNGSLSQNKDIDTNYETYYRTIIKELGKSHIKEYKEILERLQYKPDQFYKRVIQSISKSMMKRVVRDAKITSLEILRMRDIPIRTISGFTCPTCFYSNLCNADLRNLDSEFIRKKEFMDKKEELEYGEEKEED